MDCGVILLSSISGCNGQSAQVAIMVLPATRHSPRARGEGWGPIVRLSRAPGFPGNEREIGAQNLRNLAAPGGGDRWPGSAGLGASALRGRYRRKLKIAV